MKSKRRNWFCWRRALSRAVGCRAWHPSNVPWLACLAVLVGLVWVGPAAVVGAAAVSDPELPQGVLTNALEVRRLSLRQQNVLCAVHLEGICLWTSPARDRFLLQIDPGAIPVEMDLRHQPALSQGQRVVVEGNAIVGSGRVRETLVDNDGLHPPLERTESIYLPAGRLPLRVAWFNGPATFALKVEYAPPGLARQPVPDSALWRAEQAPVGGTPCWTHGLEYRCYEGNWQRLPEFRTLPVVKHGTTPNFNLEVRTRDLQVALEWTGYLEVPQAGLYTFWLNSDDGSRLVLGGTSLRLTPRGPVSLPTPRPVAVGQPTVEGQWVQVEGVLTSCRRSASGETEAELSSGTNRLYVEVAEDTGHAPELLSPVRVRGFCRPASGGTGQGQASRVLVQGWRQVEALGEALTPSRRQVTRVAELRRLGATGDRTQCGLVLQGLVLAASPQGNWLVLQDDSGAALIEISAVNPPVQPGQTVVVTGTAVVEGMRFRLDSSALVDNDRVHQPTEKAGMIYLQAGRHPLHLSWFNAEGPAALEVEYAGPGVPRQKLPDTALVHAEPEPGGGALRWVPGLAYCAYEGPWVRIPDPGLLLPAREGMASNFDLRLVSRPIGVDLEFSGWLEVPADGVYTFWVRSDDGSRLCVGESAPSLEVTGSHPVPPPAHLVPCQSLREGQEGQWSQVEGTVQFVSQEADGLVLDLGSPTGPMRLLVSDPAGCAPRLLLNSRIRATGLPQLTYTSEGQQVAGALLVPGGRQIEFVQMAAERWREFPLLPLQRLVQTNAPRTLDGVVHLRGELRSAAPGAPLVLADGTEQVEFETTQAPPTNAIAVEALGRWVQVGNRVRVQGGCFRPLASQPDSGPGTLPLLTTIEQVKSLSREEAGRGYPVRVQGILTVPLLGGFFMQDSSWAIYVSWDEGTNTTLHAGDYWEVEGKTFAEFAPNIQAHRAVRLGAGTLPVPLRPTWDQLNNGSLDTRYVEVQGIVIATDGDGLTLLTRSGKINVQLPEAVPGSLRPYENALIRVRGCLMPGRNNDTQEVELGRIELLNSSLMVDEPAPADPFSSTLKRTTDLLLFDLRAGAIQRVKVAGQVVQARRGEYFLLEGTSGLRFVPRTPSDFVPGDLVEVVGFPLLGGPSPVLREAVARRVGRAALPPPRVLSDKDLQIRQREATLVRVKARLMNVSFNRAEEVLELQAGARGFVARLDGSHGLRSVLLPGSRLELTGVYTGLGGDAAAGRALDSFELLLNSPADIRVLARPSWWSLRHTLTVVGGMALVLMAAMIWISLLRRQVEERSQQLAVAIRRQENAEGQRRLEAERARVARDLHDDLGAALTEIGLRGGLAQRTNAAPDRVREHLGHITDKAREMVTTLDEIVWSLNPKQDSLASLSKYFCEYAQQFLQLTPVRCRLEVAEALPDCTLNSDQRHHLLLAFKEALTNVVRHSQATEAHIGIGVQDGSLVLTVSDDGRGWDPAARPQGADGLENLSRRLQELGGYCEISSQAGRGTCVRMSLPVINPTALGSGRG